MDWIKLTDKKPPLNATVLIFRQGYNIYDTIYYTSIDVARYALSRHHEEQAISATDIQHGEDSTVSGEFPFDDVTHWMPLSESTKQLDKTALVRLYAEKLQEE